tara:strand:+ start:11180 stop:11416 length:237 start_codon:yes stop_codon:yes gene_type:complete
MGFHSLKRFNDTPASVLGHVHRPDVVIAPAFPFVCGVRETGALNLASKFKPGGHSHLRQVRSGQVRSGQVSTMVLTQY